MIMLETASNIVVPDQYVSDRRHPFWNSSLLTERPFFCAYNRGEPWHRLRQEDFGEVDLDASPELFELIRGMMRADPARRLQIGDVHAHRVVSRARVAMDRQERVLRAHGASVFPASPLGRAEAGFLSEILDRPVGEPAAAPHLLRHIEMDDEDAMDLSA
jgi:mitosis inhibitor protein kinase SWE1